MRGRKERGASFHGEYRSHEIRDWKLLTEEQVRGWGSGLTLRITQTSASTFAAGCQLKEKEKSQPVSRVVFFGGNVKDSNLGGKPLSSPEKTAPQRWEVESGYVQVCNKGSRKSEHQRYCEVRQIRYQVYGFSGG